MTNDENAISYFIEEIENTKMKYNIEEIMNQIEGSEKLSTNCYEKMTNKELLLICEYYGVKAKKMTKEHIIHCLDEFEKDVSNAQIVHHRQTMWLYMNELKNDKFMKKFVIW
jgi:tRNA 2-selenouridine synthase SelU